MSTVSELEAPFIYLASQSPRRRQLLDQLCVRHELLLPEPHEDAEALEAERAGESPEDYVRRVTLAKWEAARLRLASRQATQGLPTAPVLCADTTVAIGPDILAKPVDHADAARMLARLSGRTHRVLTAVVVDGNCLLSTSHVTWRTISADEIDRYVASGEPMGKAGAYAIQSQAAAWMPKIEGSYSGIMGLPLYETAELLRPLGWRF
ncbi:MAG: Maf family protein [Aquabacterium sp.]|uniref:Maf family protein n=1 Tax=Aquabacterium sp. TaxID=1872578 RepID=UPI0027248489|nr:Maf family protein [Aquabacterium sp.]MDO9003147.1 Maf family protein [Aquabacterium sp.]